MISSPQWFTIVRMRDFSELIEAAQQGRFRHLNISTEQIYHERWINEYDAHLTPAQLALQGGMLADRLAFLFIAGYQATIRASFPGIDLPDWAAFAVSEDQTTDDPKPGVQLADKTLSGFKTWIAASRSVQHLIITVGPPREATYLHIPVERENLLLHHRNEPAFLSEMSQGTAEFRGTAVSDEDHLTPVDIRLFGQREPLYLYIAFCGFLLAHTATDCRELLAVLLDLTESDLNTPESKSAFATADRTMADLFQAVPADVTRGKWREDQGLISLYSKGIQKRAEKAAQTA